MADCLRIADWHVCTREELVAYFDASDAAETKREMLAVRTHLRPVDVYSYLRARFGKPNGFQTVLRRDDSDNLIHWDYLLRVDECHVYFSATSRETHIAVDDKMTDEQWKELIVALKLDFGTRHLAKAAIMDTFEKFAVFPNKFMALASLCADLHEQIVNAPDLGKLSAVTPGKENSEEFRALSKAITERGSKLWGDALKLRLLTPIMAEAYINMLILTFCRSEVRDDAARYEAVIRERILTNPH